MQKNIFVFICLIALFACNKNEAPTLQTPIFETLMPSVYMSKFKSIASAQLVDVRTLSEYNMGHRSEAKSIDINSSDFDTKAVQILDKSKAVFIYCQSGNRSKIAAQRLQTLNFLIIYNLQGGYADIKDL
jgi:rhodanese-related sulfurtransferase